MLKHIKEETNTITTENFAFWLKGYFELTGVSNDLTPMQVQIIKDHLDLMFKKETPNRGVRGVKLNEIMYDEVPYVAPMYNCSCTHDGTTGIHKGNPCSATFSKENLEEHLVNKSMGKASDKLKEILSQNNGGKVSLTCGHSMGDTCGCVLESRDGLDPKFTDKNWHPICGYGQVVYDDHAISC